MAWWPGEPREKHVKGRLPDLGEAAYRRRERLKAFWAGIVWGFGFPLLFAFALWLLSLAFCSGCIEVRHHFDPVPIELGWAPVGARAAQDGGSK